MIEVQAREVQTTFDVYLGAKVIGRVMISYEGDDGPVCWASSYHEDSDEFEDVSLGKNHGDLESAAKELMVHLGFCEQGKGTDRTALCVDFKSKERP